jgi:hypothetical protein
MWKFPPSDEGREPPTLLGPLGRAILTGPVVKGPNRVGVSLPSPGDGSKSNFLWVVHSGYLELRTKDKV